MNRRSTRLLLATTAASLAAAAPAGARVVEVGDTGAVAPAPSCPASPCEVVSRTTAYQTRVGAQRRLFAAPADGRIVAWTITLGAPRPKQLAFFEENLGGAAQAGITVLREGTRRYGRVVAQSPLETLTPWFGQTVQFPLERSLPVLKGNQIALTVPTWAPALGLGLGRDVGWRASRALDGCDDTQTQSAQLTLAALTRYKCYYRTARLTYSATMVTTPVPPKPKPTPKPPRRRPPSGQQ